MSYDKIIRKAKNGNKTAFQELIQLEKYKLYRMAYIYVKNENDAVDIVQDTIYKAMISIKSLKEPQYFSSWLTRILINSALDHLKRNKKIIPLEDIGTIKTKENHSIEERLDLLDAIGRLDEEYKSVVVLRFYNDFTVKQIAETLNCPEGTVKTRLHRAIQKLKVELREECIND